MQLKTYLIYCLILYLVLVIRTLLYIEKEKTRRAEKKGRTKQKEREPWRRMPPTSRPFLASPSAPSDVFTIHTIDSRSHLTTSRHHRRYGRTPRPLLGAAIATTSPPPRHRSTSNQTGSPAGCLPSSPPRPLPRLSSPFPGGKGEGREPARAGDPLPLTLPTLSTLPWCLGILADTS